MRSPLIATTVAAILVAGGAAPAFAASPVLERSAPVFAVSPLDAAGSTTVPLVTSSGVVDDGPAQSDPDPEAEGGRLAFVLVPLLAAAVVVVGAIVVIARGRRGRRGD
jgi:hypothetical protein